HPSVQRSVTSSPDCSERITGACWSVGSADSTTPFFGGIRDVPHSERSTEYGRRTPWPSGAHPGGPDGISRAEHASRGESVSPDATRVYPSISPHPGRPDPRGIPSLNRLIGHVSPEATSRSTTLGFGVPTRAGPAVVGGENTSPAPSLAPSPK